MISFRQLIYVTTLIFGLLSTVDSIPLEKRLAAGSNETGGSAAIEYYDPKTKLRWLKHYHVRKSDGFIVEATYNIDTTTWSSTDLGPSVTGDRNGGLAAFAYIGGSDGNTATIHLFYDDLSTGYLKSVNWTTSAGWGADESYNSVASQWNNTARSAAAITFSIGGKTTFEVYITTATLITRISWNQISGWANENLDFVSPVGFNRDIAVITWGTSSIEISVFYAVPAGPAGFWDIQELRYSSTTGSWATQNLQSIFNNFYGVDGIGLASIVWLQNNNWDIRVYAQGDSYVELYSTDTNNWSIGTLGNCTAENIIRQGQISAVHWAPISERNSIRYFQVKCSTDSDCEFPIFQVKTYDSLVDKQNWHTFELALTDETQ